MSSIKLIQYSEDQWFAYSEDQRQDCKESWIRKWLPVEDFHRIVLKLVPDPVFPRHEDKQYPYVEWQYDLAANRAPPKLFEVDAKITIVVSSAASLYHVPLRRQIELELLKYPNGTKYEVFNEGCEKPVMQGKVNK